MEEQHDTAAENGWRRISADLVGSFAMFDVRREMVEAPGADEPLTFDIALSPPGVVIIARTLDGHLILVRQYRPAIAAWSLELPAGVVDPDEDIIDAALRELLEETGHEAVDARYLGELVLNPSWQNSVLHVVACEDATRAGDPQTEAAEDLRVLFADVDEVTRLIRAGELNNVPALAALALETALAKGIGIE